MKKKGLWDVAKAALRKERGECEICGRKEKDVEYLRQTLWKEINTLREQVYNKQNDPKGFEAMKFTWLDEYTIFGGDARLPSDAADIKEMKDKEIRMLKEKIAQMQRDHEAALAALRERYEREAERLRKKIDMLEADLARAKSRHASSGAGGPGKNVAVQTDDGGDDGSFSAKNMARHMKKMTSSTQTMLQALEENLDSLVNDLDEAVGKGKNFEGKEDDFKSWLDSLNVFERLRIRADILKKKVVKYRSTFTFARSHDILSVLQLDPDFSLDYSRRSTEDLHSMYDNKNSPRYMPRDYRDLTRIPTPDRERSMSTFSNFEYVEGEKMSLSLQPSQGGLSSSPVDNRSCSSLLFSMEAPPLVHDVGFVRGNSGPSHPQVTKLRLEDGEQLAVSPSAAVPQRVPRLFTSSTPKALRRSHSESVDLSPSMTYSTATTTYSPSTPRGKSSPRVRGPRAQFSHTAKLRTSTSQYASMYSENSPEVTRPKTSHPSTSQEVSSSELMNVSPMTLPTNKTSPSANVLQRLPGKGTQKSPSIVKISSPRPFVSYD